MTKEKLMELEGKLADGSAALYLAQRASIEEDFEDIKSVCKIVADLIDSVRCEMKDEYLRMIKA